MECVWYKEFTDGCLHPDINNPSYVISPCPHGCWMDRKKICKLYKPISPDIQEPAECPSDPNRISSWNDENASAPADDMSGVDVDTMAEVKECRYCYRNPHNFLCCSNTEFRNAHTSKLLHLSCPVPSSARDRFTICKFYEPEITLDIPTCHALLALVRGLKRYGECEMLIDGYKDGHADAIQRVEMTIQDKMAKSIL